MTRIEIHTYLAKKVEAAWMAYESAMLQRPARSIFAKAGEIDATRTCFEELALNAKAYPDNLLEHLLRFENPLETVREQWMREQNVDCSGAFRHALWSLCEYGPEPEDTPAIGGMTME
ncbi:hypothetical protein AALA80_04965 [Oscillospiraceae bacterium 50-60]